jgi:hypothetical protein
MPNMWKKQILADDLPRMLWIVTNALKQKTTSGESPLVRIA